MSIGGAVIYVGIFVALCVILLMVQNLVRFLCILFCSNSGRNRFEGQFVEETIPYEYPQSSGNFVINSEVVVFQFEKDDEGGYLAVNKDCAICLGEFEEGEWLELLPNCTHAFHVSCIDTWFRSHSNCPLCRSYVRHNTVTNYSDSLYTLLESSRSQDFSTETPPHFQSNQIPQNLEIITDHSCPLTYDSSPD